jgi:lycopene cyclase domain-containing protein
MHNTSRLKGKIIKMATYNYAIWLLLFLVMPCTILWLIFYKTLIKYVEVILIMVGLVLMGLIWDFWGVRYAIWSFPKGHNFGLYIFGLPLEEYLAFVLFAVFVSSLTIVLRFHGHLKIDKKRR